MYKIHFSRIAEKEYKSLHKKNILIFKKIRSALLSLAGNPYIGKPLKLSLKGKWSYRAGVYRIIYSIEKKILTIHILDIGHRKYVYKVK
ncbi:MAG: type II toxin-antitoxin system RelE/ParE family toxin [Candidatus Omnitrophota bacterium]